MKHLDEPLDIIWMQFPRTISAFNSQGWLFQGMGLDSVLSQRLACVAIEVAASLLLAKGVLAYFKVFLDLEIEAFWVYGLSLTGALLFPHVLYLTPLPSYLVSSSFNACFGLVLWSVAAGRSARMSLVAGMAMGVVPIFWPPMAAIAPLFMSVFILGTACGRDGMLKGARQLVFIMSGFIVSFGGFYVITGDGPRLLAALAVISRTSRPISVVLTHNVDDALHIIRSALTMRAFPPFVAAIVVVALSWVLRRFTTLADVAFSGLVAIGCLGFAVGTVLHTTLYFPLPAGMAIAFASTIALSRHAFEGRVVAGRFQAVWLLGTLFLLPYVPFFGSSRGVVSVADCNVAPLFILCGLALGVLAARGRICGFAARGAAVALAFWATMITAERAMLLWREGSVPLASPLPEFRALRATPEQRLFSDELYALLAGANVTRQGWRVAGWLSPTAMALSGLRPFGSDFGLGAGSLSECESLKADTLEPEERLVLIGSGSPGASYVQCLRAVGLDFPEAFSEIGRLPPDPLIPQEGRGQDWIVWVEKAKRS
ncbi:hypothetical protein amb0113 [Paramagnetospirillum magneticum AMB-1]|uniref:Uncharacterized protein n=2 Tax=Paramagnetospirillum magneticum TaxID=84159 RepID=Q2WB58_PARM1|nr:hypothetical protein amb0113 [Paramagnetospirillum magneticum AMB-1]